MNPDPNPGGAEPNAPHLALYRRWRAQTFSRIVGQDAVVATLRNAVRTGQVAHALLFVGPRGTGKTSMARIVAKALNCTNLQDGDPCDTCAACVAIREGRALDVVELDAATNNKVDDMRELLERTWTAPSDLRRKVYIIDEVQRITQGWDVLLRTLEEPPDHVAFIFCTTDASQIRPAVLSRVQRFEFRRLTVPEIEGKLTTILEADGRAADPDAVALVARQAAGGMRDAESMLDQLLASSSERLTVDAVRDLLGLVDAEVIERFLGALVDGDVLAGIAVLDDLEAAGRDLGAFLDQLVVALRESLSAALRRPAARSDGPSAERLTAAARRIAAIDPSRQGVGGLRFQLELALIDGVGGTGGREAMASTAAAASIASGNAASPERAVAAPSIPRTAALRRAVPVEAASPPATPAEAPPASPAVRNDEPSPAEPVAPDEKPAAAPRPSRGAAKPAPTNPDRDAPPARPADPGVPTMPLGVPPTGDLAELDAAWPAIVADLSSSPPIRPLIAVCRPIAVEGNLVTLGFPEGQSFLKDVAERRRATLEAGIGRALGRPVAVRLEATNLDLRAEPLDPEAERVMAAARRIFGADLVDADEVG